MKLRTHIALALLVAAVAVPAARAGAPANQPTRVDTSDVVSRYLRNHAQALVVAAPAALADSFITDTLGGNGPSKHAAPGYRFITDTLAPGVGASLAVAPSSPGFSWADAGVGAGTAAGAVLVLLGGTLLVVRRRGTLAI